jgi:hypothetical protein
VSANVPNVNVHLCDMGSISHALHWFLCDAN